VNTESNGRVILVVEDEWLIRDEIASALRDVGWQVFEAGSGEAATAVAECTSNIDVLFTDIQLYGLQNGWDVAEAFRIAHPTSGVVYASGNAPDRTRSVIGSRFFDKPYRVADVLAACEELVR
jgi:CheY-like chemotaxis protein